MIENNGLRTVGFAQGLTGRNSGLSDFGAHTTES